MRQPSDRVIPEGDLGEITELEFSTHHSGERAEIVKYLTIGVCVLAFFALLAFRAWLTAGGAS